MPDEPEVIRQQMEETRASLTDKLETLEKHVVDTVSDSTAAVSDTVTHVKEVVQDTVDTVKETFQESVASVRDAFDLSQQVEKHPWLFLSGSIALGYVGGRLLDQALAPPSTERWSSRGSAMPATRSMASVEGSAVGNGARGAGQETARSGSDRARSGSGAGLLSSLVSQFSPEIDKAKSVLVGAGLGILRDFVTQSVPEPLQPKVSEVMDSFTTKLGGEVVRGPVCESMRQEASCGAPANESRRPEPASSMGAGV